MAAYPSLPIFTDAILGDTQHLSDAEFGSYMLLLIVSWRSPTCDLADDDVKLARVARCSLKVWRASRRAALAGFFTTEGGVWRQKKLLKVRAHVEEVSAKRSAAASTRYSSDSPREGDLPSGGEGQNGPKPLELNGTSPAKAPPFAGADASLSKTKSKEEEKEKDEGAAAPSSRYAFQGEVVRLNERDLRAIKEACPSIPVEAELLAYDAILAVKATPEERKNAFWSVKARMAKLERQASERLALERERIASCGTPVRDWRLDPSNPFDSLPG